MTSTRSPSADPRFQYGRNWRNFAARLDERRIAAAEDSLRAMLGRRDLRGASFLDIGCGSGLFSLAAARLGAEPIESFDYDAESVATTESLRTRFRPDATWKVERGDATSHEFMSTLGAFDVVYAWGVLSLTGDMWRAMEETAAHVAPGGVLWLAVYNDQGRRSAHWRGVKRRYNRLPRPARVPYALAAMLPLESRNVASAVLHRQLRSYLRGWTETRTRGMSRWHDLLDWVGGYPFEVATPAAIFRFFRDRGFLLEELMTAGGGLGNNEFVFRRSRETVTADVPRAPSAFA